MDSREWRQRFPDNEERFTLPNSLRQNYRHRRAVEDLISDRLMLVRAHVVSAGSAEFEGELADAMVPVTALAQLLTGAPPIPQSWLYAAWLKLQAAVERSP